MTREFIEFWLVVGLGCLAYVGATLAARWLSPVPRHVYYGRLIFLALFYALIVVFFLPSRAEGFSGDPARYYDRMMIMRGMGTVYGLPTLLIWPVLALINWPKRERSNHQTSR
jgi:hypothetical protein